MTGVGLCVPQLEFHVTAEVIRTFAQRAESLGFSSLWVQDHFMYVAHPQNGYGNFPGGRLVVGLGAGWSKEEHTAVGTDFRQRGSRMEEFISVLHSCWGADPVRHRGPFFEVPECSVNPKPVQRADGSTRPPLSVWHRTFVSFPARPGRAQPGIDGLRADLEVARAKGFREVIVECNFWEEIDSPAAWLAVPDRLSPLLG